ncbi:hypothetical protein QJS66_07250 [Kocuria rhizophila]|nr:hypothetical protein QJS66_07250 [Kocuria rhizophila]
MPGDDGRPLGVGALSTSRAELRTRSAQPRAAVPHGLALTRVFMAAVTSASRSRCP